MQLTQYGLTPKGQRWPTDNETAWMTSAQEAAEANAAIVILIGSAQELASEKNRRDLALFRLSLQTLQRKAVNGLALVSGEPLPGDVPKRAGVLTDWLSPTDARWPARAVARAHAPVAPKWPARLGLYAQERLGVWLEVHPAPYETSSGALAGVSGNEASISFHATGPAGALPERSINEYELQGLKFNIGDLVFEAWGLQNTLAPEHSYYVRIEGKPDYLAVGSLPNGQLEEVHVISLTS
jgi:hypothetical protein